MYIIAAMIMICAAMSTPETRAQGKVLIAPYARICGWVSVAIWLAILGPLLF